MIRVGFDVTFANRVGTGVGVYARNLAAALARRSVDLRRWEHTLARATNRRRRMTNGVRLAAWQSVGCARQARRDAVDLVHAAAPIGPLGVGCPVVMTVHDATGVTMPLRTNPGDSLFHRVFSEHAARRADALLVPSRAAADDVVEHYGVDASRIRVVPLGVADAFRLVTADDVATVRRAYGLDRPYVLYVGADTPRKNLDRLIAAKASDRRLDELDLVIAGPPARMAGRLEAFGKERGLPRPIRWVFDVPDAALPGLYGGAACLAYVSLWEGFGLPIIEAMAAGVPVVTANRASMPEVAGDAALLVDPTDVPAIADALARAVHDTQLAGHLRRLGTARSAAFTWDVTARLTEAVYRDVTGRGDVVEEWRKGGVEERRMEERRMGGGEERRSEEQRSEEQRSEERRSEDRRTHGTRATTR